MQRDRFCCTRLCLWGSCTTFAKNKNSGLSFALLFFYLVTLQHSIQGRSHTFLWGGRGHKRVRIKGEIFIENCILRCHYLTFKLHSRHIWRKKFMCFFYKFSCISISVFLMYHLFWKRRPNFVCVWHEMNFKTFMHEKGPLFGLRHPPPLP